MQRYLDEFQEGGLPRLRRLPWQGRHGALQQHQAALEDYFLDHPPRSARQAQAVIEQQTGIRRGLTQVRAFLKKSPAPLAQDRDHPGQG